MECNGSYIPPSYVEHLHSLPRLDFRFDAPQNVTFEPKEKSYWEGIAVWGLILAGSGFLLFLGVTFYLICKRCCCRQRRRYDTFSSHKYGQARCLLFLVATVALTIVGLAIYGVTASIYDGDLVIDKAQDGERMFSRNIQEVDNLMTELVDDVEYPIESLTDSALKKRVLNLLDGIVANLSSASSTLGSTDINSAVDTAETYVHYWEYGSIPAVSWLAFVALVFTFGVFCCTRCSIRLAIFLTLLGIIVAFVTGAVAFCLAMAGSDFCMDPDHYLLKYSSSLGPRKTVEYYICCTDEADSPFEELKLALSVTHDTEEALDSLKLQLEKENLPLEVEAVEKAISAFEKASMSLNRTAEDVECQGVNKLYHDARSAICENGIVSLIVLSSAAMATSLIFVVLIACGNHVVAESMKPQSTRRHEEHDTEREPLYTHQSTSMESTSLHGEPATLDRDQREEEAALDPPPPSYDTFIPNDGSDNQ